MRISDWSSDVCSSDLLHDSGKSSPVAVETENAARLWGHAGFGDVVARDFAKARQRQWTPPRIADERFDAPIEAAVEKSGDRLGEIVGIEEIADQDHVDVGKDEARRIAGANVERYGIGGRVALQLCYRSGVGLARGGLPGPGPPCGL